MHLFPQLDDRQLLETWGKIFNRQMAGYVPGQACIYQDQVSYPVAWQGTKMPELNNIDSRECICLGEVM